MKKRILKKSMDWRCIKEVIEDSYDINYPGFPSFKKILNYYRHHQDVLTRTYIPELLRRAGFDYLNYEYYECGITHRVINGKVIY